jgi:glycerol-3-phosphate acyltransferase PlsY
MLVSDLAAIVLAYLLGSIPFAHITARNRAGLDIRQVGIGNAGARNVWHVVGPGWGILVAVLDAAKGLASVLLARALGAGETAVLLVGPATIVGHAFPLFLRFRGGKGLSTAFGVLLAWTPWSTGLSLVVLVTIQLLLGNLDRSIPFAAAAAILLPLLFGHRWTMALYALGLFGLLWARKLQDRSHQRRVWLDSGWQGTEHSDWYGPSRSGQASGDESAQGTRPPNAG